VGALVELASKLAYYHANLSITAMLCIYMGAGGALMTHAWKARISISYWSAQGIAIVISRQW